MDFHLPNQPIRTSVEKGRAQALSSKWEEGQFAWVRFGKEIKGWEVPRIEEPLISSVYFLRNKFCIQRQLLPNVFVDRIAPCFPVTREWVAELQAMEGKCLPALLQQNQRALDLSVHLTQSFLRSRGRGWGWVVGIKVVNFLSASPLK